MKLADGRTEDQKSSEATEATAASTTIPVRFRDTLKALLFDNFRIGTRLRGKPELQADLESTVWNELADADKEAFISSDADVGVSHNEGFTKTVFVTCSRIIGTARTRAGAQLGGEAAK